MATSITAAGIVFPDSSEQTTAASASGGTTEAVASGALSDGSTVIVNADGTVSVVATVAQSAGTPVIFNNASTSQIAATYDSTNNRVVVSYSDGANSSHGTAVVGTVSGTSISFGTPVVFESANTNSIVSVFNFTAGKIVIAYRDSGNSSHGTAIVGTVSGTSISFGTAAVFETSNTSAIGATFDSVNEKIVIAYRDVGNSGYGTAVVGTVSGTSISFGTPVVFESASSDPGKSSTTFDSVNSKVVIAYRDSGNSGFGTAIVGTVSGTSISFGTAVVFSSASTNNAVAVYDTASGKVAVMYRNDGNSNYGTAIVGTVSGTSISFGTAVVFRSADVSEISAAYDSTNSQIITAYQDDSAVTGYGTVRAATVSGTSISFGAAIVFENSNTQQTSTTFDSTNNKAVIAYRDDPGVSPGTAVVYTPPSGNLTAENYIGISDGAYTNGQTATIQLVGSVDDAQTGLTAGQKYYVQVDGTLGLSPADPSVLAGTAVSATKLIIKR